MQLFVGAILSFWIFSVTAQCPGSESINKVKIVGLLEVHPYANCGNTEELLTYSLSQALAAEYALDLVNNDNSDVAVPGVQYEFQLEDICRNRSLATRSTAMNIPKTVWTDQNFCFNQSSDSDQQDSLLLGFVGPVYSSNAKYVAEFLNNTNIPVISPGATLPELSDKTQYYSLLRTVPSDDLQSKAIIKVAHKLEWSYVLLIHTDDSYGRQGAEAIKTYGELEGICFSDVIEVELDPANPSDYYDDLTRRINSDLATGIIYFGHEESIIRIIDSYLYLSRQVPPTHRKVILTSEGVDMSTNLLERVESNDDKLGIIAVSLHKNTNNLEQYIRERIDGTKSGLQSTNALIDQFISECSNRDHCTDEALVTESYGTQATIEAVVSLLYAFKETHNQICKGKFGVCKELSDSPLFYSAMLESLSGVAINVSIGAENIVINFDSLREMDNSTTTPAYALNVASQSNNMWIYEQVGLYHHNESWIYINENFLSQNSDSRCKTDCEICMKKLTSYMYQRSETSRYIIAGAAHVTDDLNLHDCGQDVAAIGFLLMESFYYAVEQIKAQTNIEFSTLFIDTCGANLATHTIMNDIFREENTAYLTDSAGKEWAVRPTDFVVFLTGSTSGDALVLESYLNLYSIPQISYKSTSVWLSDSLRHPTFLRNVPSDEEQARLMIELAVRYGWTNIGLIYADTVYGETGSDLIQKHASKNGICISYLRKVARVAQEIKELANDIQKTAEDNLLPRVIIIFAEDPLITDFLQKIKLYSEWKERGNILIGSETWGNLQHVVDGVEEFVYGSLTFAFSGSTYKWTVDGTNYFQDYLETQKPENNKENKLFLRFWQQYFDCYLPQDSLPSAETKCKDALSLAFTDSVAKRLDYEESTGKHSVMAGLSVAYAIREAIYVERICDVSDDLVDCSNLFDTDFGRGRFFQLLHKSKIPEQVNSSTRTYAPFLESGDGKANYDIYNIIDNSEPYALAYRVNNGNLTHVAAPKFYIDGFPDSNPESSCGTICDCVNPITVHDAVVITAEPSPSEGWLLPMLIVILALLLLLLVGLAALIIIIQRSRFTCSEKKLSNEGHTEVAVNTRHQSILSDGERIAIKPLEKTTANGMGDQHSAAEGYLPFHPSCSTTQNSVHYSDSEYASHCYEIPEFVPEINNSPQHVKAPHSSTYLQPGMSVNNIEMETLDQWPTKRISGRHEPMGSENFDV